MKAKRQAILLELLEQGSIRSQTEAVRQLQKRGIVATHIEGPTQNVVNQTNQSMISDNEFILVSGVVGVMVSVVGIYFDAVVVSYRKFKKFLNKKVKR